MAQCSRGQCSRGPVFEGLRRRRCPQPLPSEAPPTPRAVVSSRRPRPAGARAISTGVGEGFRPVTWAASDRAGRPTASNGLRPSRGQWPSCTGAEPGPAASQRKSFGARKPPSTPLRPPKASPKLRRLRFRGAQAGEGRLPDARSTFSGVLLALSLEPGSRARRATLRVYRLRSRPSDARSPGVGHPRQGLRSAAPRRSKQCVTRAPAKAHSRGAP